MNTESCDCRYLGTDCWEQGAVILPGDFKWEEDFSAIYICLPGDATSTCILVQRGAPGGNRVWGWDGNVEKPTLQPSINWVGCWHGHLVAGRLISC